MHYRDPLSKWTLLSFIPVARIEAPVAAIGRNTLLALGLSLGLAITFIVYMSRKVVMPITTITRHFIAIQDGRADLEMRLPVTSQDEIGRLAQWFNVFIESLMEKRRTEEALLESREQLRRSHEVLERRVEERTGDLRQANEALRTEIAERKRSEEAARRRTRQLEAIRAVSIELTRELDLSALLHLITDRVVGLVGAGQGMIRLWDGDSQSLVQKTFTGSGLNQNSAPLRLGEGVARLREPWGIEPEQVQHDDAQRGEREQCEQDCEGDHHAGIVAPPRRTPGPSDPPCLCDRLQQVRERIERDGQERRRRARRVERADPLRLCGGELRVGRGDAREELVGLALEPVRALVAPAAARPPIGGVDREQQRAIGDQARGRKVVDRADRLDAEPAPRSLVGQRGVNVAVEQHPAPGRQRRRHARRDQLRARRGVEQRLGAVGDLELGILDQGADPLGERDAARLPQQDRVDAPRAERLVQRGGERRLAGAVDALDRDQAGGHERDGSRCGVRLNG